MNFRAHAADKLELNLTPLIDVVFLLLIFFMVSTTFQKESELSIQLPEATAQATPSDTKIELVINQRGEYFINGQELVNNQAETLREALQRASRNSRDLPLVIRADAQTPHQAVITAMDAAARLGLTRMSIATSKTN